jgi:hypothetical protein
MTQKNVLSKEKWAKKFGSGLDKKLYGQLARFRRTEERQRSGSQYARDHAGEPGRNGGPKGE